MAPTSNSRQASWTTHWATGGFRPFFFLGSLAMAGSVAVWLCVLMGTEIPTAFAARDWHIHTLLFGGIPALVAGFALTAVANWTGRPPVAGPLLGLLVALWLAGRVAISTSALIGPLPAAFIDLSFPAALTAVFAREVILGKNLRNLRVVALVALITLGDTAFHWEALHTGLAVVSARAGIAVILTLVMLIAGRIVPAFTRNWLTQRRAEKLPIGFNRFDAVALGTAIAALACWVVAPETVWVAAPLALAGVLHAVRLGRWQGWATRREPLLIVLHVAYATIPAGFLAVAAGVARPDIVSAASALHIWTAGTFGLMTLAVMTRASRGHSGRPLVAGPLEQLIYVLAFLGTAARVAAPYAGGLYVHVLDAAGLLWAGAYLAFAVGYVPILLLPPRPVAGMATARG
jgi:uncharacterized protein involved in response to NO